MKKKREDLPLSLLVKRKKYNLSLPSLAVSNQVYGLVNRWVFSMLLKLSKELHFLISLGRLFHRVGVAILKDLDAKVFLLILGITNKSDFLDDLRPCLGRVYSFSSSLKYFGPSPCSSLKVSTSILKVILFFYW